MTDNSNVIITTSHASKCLDSELLAFVENCGWPLVNREHRSIPLLMEIYGVENVIVWSENRPLLYTGGKELFFHPSMAKNRLSFYRKKGLRDMMMKAIDISPGDSFLDCTFGLGSDAIVASYFSESGDIVGLESSAPIARVVGWGMKSYSSRMLWLDSAIHRIKLINHEHRDFLQALAPNSFDIIYFDPMFREPMMKSVSMNPLRPLTNNHALLPESIQAALKAARKRVVIKERLSSGEHERLGVHRIMQSKNNPIAYGILDK